MLGCPCSVVGCVAFVDISHYKAFTCVLKSTLLNACVSLRFATFEQLVRIQLLWALRSRTTRLDHEVNARSLFFLKNRTAVLNNLKITRKLPGLCSRDPCKSQTDPNSPQISETTRGYIRISYMPCVHLPRPTPLPNPQSAIVHALMPL